MQEAEKWSRQSINLILAAAGHNLRLILAWLRRLCALILVVLIAQHAEPADT
jgi:hypothetical protein